jgi:hypothetical protein
LRCGVVTAVLAISAGAEASPPPTFASAPPQTAISTDRTWYGWQTLILDASSVATFATGAVLFARQGSTETLAPQVLLWSGVAGSILGAPIVHWAHTNTGRGFASLGMRFSGLLLFALANPEGKGEPAVAAFGLAVLGSAVVLDAAVFGYEDRVDARSISGWSISPVLGKRTGFTLGHAF